MRFSLSWLRELCPAPGETAELAAALTARGLTVDALLDHGGETVLDIDVPANRPDCLGHLGMARELSAAFGVDLALRRTSPASSGPASACMRIEIADPTDCARFTARQVSGVHVGPSPDWVVRRLEACEIRSINNVVDASNLVMLETGHPVHFYDRERLEGDRIGVRRARPGERLRTLDDVDRELDTDTLVIADASGAIGLAGVMGGATTEIGSGTREVLVEAARFLPGIVRGTARRLGLRTDASHRFERGVDAEGASVAQELAVRLLVELCGGTPRGGDVDAYPGRAEPARLELRFAEIERLLGYAPAADTVETALRALGFAPDPRAEDRIRVRVPSWRADVAREADLVEEVARHVGYDAIPTRTDGLPAVSLREQEEPFEDRARDVLSAAGLCEAPGYAMIGPGEDDPFLSDDLPPPLALNNPIAENLATLRRSLLPALLRAASLNQRRGSRDVRLFEVGRVFLGKGTGFPAEPSRIGLVWSGAGRPRHWSEPDREADLSDIAGLVEHTMSALGPGTPTRRAPERLPAFHPGRAVRWSAGSTTLARAGEIHPGLAERLDLVYPTFAAEVDLAALGEIERTPPRYLGISRYPEVTRDLSLRGSRVRSYAEILAALESVEAPGRTRFEVIDRYEGPPLDEDEVSLTVRLRLEPRERTLTESEIEDYRGRLVARLSAETGVVVRES